VVRDLLAHHPVADLDLATPEPPLTVMERLDAVGIKVVPTGLAHGTITAVLDGRPYEITTLRRDVETDGRHAVVAWTSDWRADAARRDFTINAMSMDRDSTLHDYFGGAADLEAGLVRFVGDARTRIEEDALRILRFFRFQARYGRAPPDPTALEAIHHGVELLLRLSPERVWSELRRLLGGPGVVEAAALMHRLGVLDALLPDGAAPDRLARLVALDAPVDPLLRLAALAQGRATPVASRLRLSKVDTERLEALKHGVRPYPGLDDDGLRRLLADNAPASLCDHSWLAAAEAGAGDPEAWSDLRRRLIEIGQPVFPLSGRDAVAAGVAAGPEVGKMLRAVAEWWREGGCRADRPACLARLAVLTAG
jgi:poly(A) polymerase